MPVWVLKMGHKPKRFGATDVFACILSNNTASKKDALLNILTISYVNIYYITITNPFESGLASKGKIGRCITLYNHQCYGNKMFIPASILPI